MYYNPDNLPLNGHVRAKKWVIWLPTGDSLDQYGDISKDYSPTSEYKYIPAVNLSKMTGMSRHRFDEIWSELQWSDQPDVRQVKIQCVGSLSI